MINLVHDCLRVFDVPETESLGFKNLDDYRVMAGGRDMRGTTVLSCEAACYFGAAYQTTVGGLMNTTVALTQAEEVGLSKTVIVGQHSLLQAGTEHKIVVGSSVLTITENRIELVADEILIRGRKKVEVHGDDIDHNPG